jgi:diguanylate cyclase (GGDEF)-like protein/PAS domain S-box-containing protein
MLRRFARWRRGSGGDTGALQAALIESRARYKALVELSSDFAWETGPDGAFVFVSPKGALGYDAAELVGRQPDDFAAAPRDPAEASPFAARARIADAVVWWRRAGGGEACLAVSAAPLEDANGRWRGARGVCRDITGSLARDDALAAAGRREGMLAHILHVMRDAASPAEMLEAAAAASARALGARTCRIHAVGTKGSRELAASFGPLPDPAAETALIEAALRAGRIAAADGPEARSIAGATLYRQAVNGMVTFARAADAPPWSDEDRALLGDIADRIGLALAQAAAHDALARLSRTDPLTGLLNRRAFLDELGARLARRGRGAATGALVYIDLDHFKAVNDAFGHQRGDAALIAVAELLVTRTRPGDLVARLGGDEFALWLERIEAGTVAQRAAELVESADRLAGFAPGGRAPLGFSIGAAVHHGGPAEPAALLARADAAMYQVKHRGKGGYLVDAADEPAAEPLGTAAQ